MDKPPAVVNSIKKKSRKSLNSFSNDEDLDSGEEYQVTGLERLGGREVGSDGTLDDHSYHYPH